MGLGRSDMAHRVTRTAPLINQSVSSTRTLDILALPSSYVAPHYGFSWTIPPAEEAPGNSIC